jgi:hypothetical protein
MSDIQPALTTEEWALYNSPRRRIPVGVKQRPHAAAAIALHGQPFGFTQEDVRDERNAENDCARLARQAQDGGDELERYKFVGRQRRHKERADRIEALLPPATP